MTSPVNILAQLNFGSASAISENIDEKLRDHLYVETKLETRLIKEILEEKFDLVLISGNAGDGKTAFLKQLEKKTNLKTFSGKQIIIDFDATESDSPEQTQVEKLSKLLEDFSDENAEKGNLSAVYVIAINTGMIMHFFNNTNKFSLLRESLIKKINMDIANSYETQHNDMFDILFIDLNNRSIFNAYNEFGDSNENNNSLYDSLLYKLVDQSSFIWEDCQNCPVSDKCFVQFNAKSLNDPLVSQRLKLLLNFVHFDSEFHVTTRNLLNILSYLIISHHSYYKTNNFCTQIQNHITILSDFEKKLDQGSIQLLSKERGLTLKKELNKLANITQKIFYNSSMNDHELFTDVKLLNNTSYGLGGELISLLNGENLINDFVNRSNYKVDEISSFIYFNLESILTERINTGLDPFEKFIFGIYGKIIERIKSEISMLASDINEEIESDILEGLKNISLELFRILKRREFFVNNKLDISDLSRYKFFHEFIELINNTTNLFDPRFEESLDLFDEVNEKIHNNIGLYLKKIIHKQQGLQYWEDDNNTFYLIKDKNIDRSLYRAYNETDFNLEPVPSFDTSQYLYMDTLYRFITLNVNGVVTFTLNVNFYEYLRSISVGYEPLESELQSISQVKILVEALKKVPVSTYKEDELFLMDGDMEENFRLYYRTAMNRKTLIVEKKR
jgi:hypothetical protein